MGSQTNEKLTVVDPRTMMVHLEDTAFANTAMVGAHWLNNITYRNELNRDPSAATTAGTHTYCKIDTRSRDENAFWG